MGQLIDLAAARADHSRPSRGAAAFFFAPGCPISYVAAESIERIFGELAWVPVLPAASSSGSPYPDRFRIAGREAALLRLPLVEPDAYPLVNARPIGRAILFAAERDAARALALASLRLAFCGGFDLADPDVLAAAAEAADLPADEVLAASLDTRYDAQLDATARGFSAQGVSETPAIRIADRWFTGLGAHAGASAFASTRARDRTQLIRTTG
jgi:2-hydroxychromene-2-carboxylate isomerase